MHDTIGCYLDLDKGQISFSKNGALSVDDFYHSGHVYYVLFVMVIADVWC